jgi:hypothetical protein
VRNDAAGRLTMQPGPKLRGKRWEPLHFENKLVSLDAQTFKSLVDAQGFAPEINIAVPVNNFGKTLQGAQQDQKLVDLLKSMVQVATSIPVGSPLTINAVRKVSKSDRRTLKPLIEMAVQQGLLDKDSLRPTSAGEAFAGDALPVTDEPEPESF